jgi:hypothetical protein
MNQRDLWCPEGADPRAIFLPDGAWAGWRVSQVLAAFGAMRASGCGAAFEVTSEENDTLRGCPLQAFVPSTNFMAFSSQSGMPIR